MKKNKITLTIVLNLLFLQIVWAQQNQHRLKLQFSNKIDSIVENALEHKAFPGAVVLIKKNGKILHYKSYGKKYFDSTEKVDIEDIFDLASITKIAATTISIMKLYEEQKIDLNKTLGEYLPEAKNTNKANLVIKNILLHEAGLIPFITFYKLLIDSQTKYTNPKFKAEVADEKFNTQVAEKFFINGSIKDTVWEIIYNSKINNNSSYVYSDLDFIFLGKIVETISGKRLDEYVYENFYHPLHMSRTGFNPTKNHSLSNIVPTEMDSFFRQQHIRGYVHDEAAAILGGVAGHAGLFSSAEDLGILFQMLLNGGIYKKKRYLKAETIQYFTSYQSLKSRRGLGFDKPEKNNSQLKVPYPALSGSEEMYGHTGFTGTCVWVEPRENLIFIFLTNRVNPTRNNGLLFTLNVRSALLESALKYSE